MNMVWLFGEIENGKLNIEFIKLDNTEFVKLEQNVEKFNSKEDLIEFINEIKLDDN